MKKFTFKKTIHEGQYRSFEKDHTTIKLNKKEVGYISEVEPRLYRAYFAVKRKLIEKTKKGSAFKWIYIRKVFESEKAAREFIKENNDKIQTNLNLHYFDD